MNQKLLYLQRTRILETRSDERLRLEHEIQPLEAERQEIEHQLEELSKGESA